MWTIKDVIEKVSDCNAYNQVYIEYVESGGGGGDFDLNIKLSYPGPTSYGRQEYWMNDIELRRSLRKNSGRGQKKYIGVDLIGKGRDDMSSRELIVADILALFDVTERKVVKICDAKQKRARREVLRLRN